MNKLIRYLRKRATYLGNRQRKAKVISKRGRMSGATEKRRSVGGPLDDSDDSDDDFGAHSEFERLTMRSTGTGGSSRKGAESVRMHSDALDLQSSASLVVSSRRGGGSTKDASMKKKKSQLSDYGIEIIMRSFERAPQDKQHIFRTHHAVQISCLGLFLLFHHILDLRSRRIRIIDGDRFSFDKF